MSETKRKRKLNQAEAECLERACSEAAGYGYSVFFWIRSNDPEEAARRARLAARWAAKALMIEGSK